MSDIEKASADAVESARQGESFAMMLAAVHAAQQQHQQPVCPHHQTPAPAATGGPATKWLALGIGGAFLAVALAVSMVAFAIGAVALTICIVVLRSIWTDFQKNR